MGLGLSDGVRVRAPGLGLERRVRVKLVTMGLGLSGGVRVRAVGLGLERWG